MFVLLGNKICDSDFKNIIIPCLHKIEPVKLRSYVYLCIYSEREKQKEEI